MPSAASTRFAKLRRPVGSCCPSFPRPPALAAPRSSPATAPRCRTRASAATGLRPRSGRSSSASTSPSSDTTTNTPSTSRPSSWKSSPAPPAATLLAAPQVPASAWTSLSSVSGCPARRSARKSAMSPASRPVTGTAAHPLPTSLLPSPVTAAGRAGRSTPSAMCPPTCSPRPASSPCAANCPPRYNRRSPACAAAGERPTSTPSQMPRIFPPQRRPSRASTNAAPAPAVAEARPRRGPALPTAPDIALIITTLPGYASTPRSLRAIAPSARSGPARSSPTPTPCWSLCLAPPEDLRVRVEDLTGRVLLQESIATVLRETRQRRLAGQPPVVPTIVPNWVFSDRASDASRRRHRTHLILGTLRLHDPPRDRTGKQPSCENAPWRRYRAATPSLERCSIFDGSV